MACHQVSIEIPYTPQRDNGLVHKTEEARLFNSHRRVLFDKHPAQNVRTNSGNGNIYNTDKKSLWTAYEMVTNNLLYLRL